MPSQPKKQLKVCRTCGGELSANELFKSGNCYICDGKPYMSESGEVFRPTRDDKISRAWERELKIN